MVAATAAMMFGGAYGLLAITSRKELLSNSKKISIASRLQIKTLQEGLGAIRDVILGGTQNLYLDIYEKIDRPHRRLQKRNSYLVAFPRYAVETLSLIGYIAWLFVSCS